MAIFVTARAPSRGVTAGAVEALAALIDPAQPADGLDGRGVGALANAGKRLASELFDGPPEPAVLDVDIPLPAVLDDAQRAQFIADMLERTSVRATASAARRHDDGCAAMPSRMTTTA